MRDNETSLLTIIFMRYNEITANNRCVREIMKHHYQIMYTNYKNALGKNICISY